MCLKNKIAAVIICSFVAMFGIFGAGINKASAVTVGSTSTYGGFSIEQLQKIVQDLQTQIQQLLQIIKQRNTNCIAEGKVVAGNGICCAGLAKKEQKISGCTASACSNSKIATCEKAATACAGEGQTAGGGLVAYGTIGLKCCSGLTPMDQNIGVKSDGTCGNVGADMSPVCAICGDGICSLGENKCNCKDCGGSTAACGNGKCDNGENSTNCAKDCAGCSSWSTVQELGGVILGNADITAADDRLVITGRGSSSALWVSEYAPATKTLTPWYSAGGQIIGSPTNAAPTPWKSGSHITIQAIGSDKNQWWIDWTAPKTLGNWQTSGTPGQQLEQNAIVLLNGTAYRLILPGLVSTSSSNGSSVRLEKCDKPICSTNVPGALCEAAGGHSYAGNGSASCFCPVTTCGNGICDSGEADYIAGGDLPSYKGTCPQDCQAATSPSFDIMSISTSSTAATTATPATISATFRVLVSAKSGDVSLPKIGAFTIKAVKNADTNTQNWVSVDGIYSQPTGTVWGSNSIKISQGTTATFSVTASYAAKDAPGSFDLRIVQVAWGTADGATSLQYLPSIPTNWISNPVSFVAGSCYAEGQGAMGYAMSSTTVLPCCSGLVQKPRMSCTASSCATAEGFICAKPVSQVCGKIYGSAYSDSQKQECSAAGGYITCSAPTTVAGSGWSPSGCFSASGNGTTATYCGGSGASAGGGGTSSCYCQCIPVVGGNCTYKQYKGTCTIIQVTPSTGSSPKIDYTFKPTVMPDVSGTFLSSANQINPYNGNTSALYLGLACLKGPHEPTLEQTAACSVVAGATFGCTLSVATGGSCTPINVTFDSAAPINIGGTWGKTSMANISSLMASLSAIASQLKLLLGR